MVYKDGFGKPLSKREQLVIGAVEGTAAIHVAPLGIPFLFSKLRDKETSPLEKIAAAVTTTLEGAAYYWMIRKGIPAHKFLAGTNVIGTLLIGGYLALDSIMPGGIQDRMSHMFNGGDYGGGFSLSPTKQSGQERDPDVIYL